MINKTFAKIIVSLFLTAICACLIVIFFYPGNSELGKSFGISAVYMMTRYAALTGGILLLLLRLVRILKKPSYLVYVFVSVLNIVCGLLAVGLFIFHAIILSGLHVSLLNLLVGAVMMGDIILFAKAG